MAEKKDVDTSKKIEPSLPLDKLRGEALLSRLLAISRHLAEMRTLLPLLSFVIDEALSLVKAERGYIVLIKADNSFEICIKRHFEGDVQVIEADPISHTVLSKVIQSGKSIVIRKAIADPDFANALSVRKKKLRSIICMPLITKSRIIGAVYLENRAKSDRFSEDDIIPLEFFGNQAAVAIENANLNENLELLVQERTKELIHAKEGLERVNKKLETVVQELAISNEQLKSSNSELEAFAHMVAHDLKAPLSNIISFSEMVINQWEQLPDHERKEYLGYIQNGGQKSIRIIDELLLLAHLRREDHIDVESLDMVLIVDEVHAQLFDMIARYHAEIKIPNSWPLALGHAPWVEIIWINYLSNAIKYGGNPPHIELGASPYSDEFHCFWVKDNGVGLSEEEKDKLFTPFTRLHKSRAKGHGLGLSIVQRIVEKLGGTVGVESQSGQGAKFFFTLPAAK